MDVSVIIVNYNTTDLVIECIKSIFKHTRSVSFEIIVVDNRSDGFSAVEIKNSWPMCHVIELNENLGFGKANNIASEIASGRNIFFLNPDTTLVNDALSTLCKFIDSTPDAGACGGNLFYQDMTPAHSFYRLFPSLLVELDMLFFFLPSYLFFGRNKVFNFGSAPLEVAYITGADLMVKRDVLDVVGWFDPRFFMYYEETELCRRIQQFRKKIYSVPTAQIIHLEGKSFSVSEFRHKTMFDSKVLFYNITYSRFYTKLAFVIWTLNAIIRKYYSKIKRSKGMVQYWESEALLLRELKGNL